MRVGIVFTNKPHRWKSDDRVAELANSEHKNALRRANDCWTGKSALKRLDVTPLSSEQPKLGARKTSINVFGPTAKPTVSTTTRWIGQMIRQVGKKPSAHRNLDRKSVV